MGTRVGGKVDIALGVRVVSVVGCGEAVGVSSGSEQAASKALPPARTASLKKSLLEIFLVSQEESFGSFSGITEDMVT